jgi:hypothetical protein
MVNDDRDHSRPEHRDRDGWERMATRRDIYDATGVDVRYSESIEHQRLRREMHQRWIENKLAVEEQQAKERESRAKQRFVERHSILIGFAFAAISALTALWGEIEKYFTGGARHG